MEEEFKIEKVWVSDIIRISKCKQSIKTLKVSIHLQHRTT
jgi:hypothetical protein